MKTFAGLLACTLSLTLTPPAGAGGCYPPYSYFPSYTSCSYPSYGCSPSYSYPSCSYSIYDGGYHYHNAGWYGGRYYQSGYYAWINSCWCLQGCGPCYGNVYGPGYRQCVDDTVFLRFAAVLPLVDLPTYSAQYTGAVTPSAVAGVGTANVYQQQATQGAQVQQTSQTVQAQQVTQGVQSAQTTQVSRMDEVLQLMKQVAEGQKQAGESHQLLAVRMDRMEKRLTALEVREGPSEGEPVPVPLPLPRTPSRPVPVPLPLPRTPSRPIPAPKNPVSYSPADLSVVQTKCAACHGAGVERPKYAPVLLTTDGLPITLSEAGKNGLDDQLVKKLMPPAKSGVTLSNAEEDSVRRAFGIRSKNPTGGQ